MTFENIKDYPDLLKEEKLVKNSWFCTCGKKWVITEPIYWYSNIEELWIERIYDLFYIHTKFCTIEVNLIYNKTNNDLRFIVDVNSRSEGWKAFKYYNSEWRRKNMTYEQFKTCIRNLQKIVHSICLEEQRIQKIFKTSMKKVGILKDTFEEV